MTTEERKAVRDALLDLGFHRVATSHNTGNGAYAEVWARRGAGDRVAITWDTKTPGGAL